jgi:hypothetical protein
MVCKRDTLRFESQTAFVYEWSNGSKNPYFVITSADEIWVKITDTVNFCERQDTISIHIFPIPIPDKQRIDTTLCFGDTLILNSGRAANTDTFYWLNPEVPANDLLYRVQDSVITVIFDDVKHSTGVYPYITMLLGYCTNYWENAIEYTVFDTAFVFFANRPIVDLGQDTTLCDDGEAFELTALSKTDFLTSKYNFLWSDNTRAESVKINYDNQGLYSVKIWNNTCKDTVSDTVTIGFWPREWTESKLLSDTAICERI